MYDKFRPNVSDDEQAELKIAHVVHMGGTFLEPEHLPTLLKLTYRQRPAILCVREPLKHLHPMPHFSLITLNCFGVPTPNTHHRLLTLARELDRQGADIVCLQEVQTHVYRRLLMRANERYPASAYEPFVHAPKGGLLTLAQRPIEQQQFTLYRERGMWYTPAVMDWILHKGVLATHLTCDDLPIVVLNTHLVANYQGDWSERNRFARSEWAQLQQLAEIVAAQPAEALIVTCGDFNIPRGSWLYERFLDVSGMIDPLAGDTRWTYRALERLAQRFGLPIDFTFVRAPQLPGLQFKSDLIFRDRLPLLGGGEGYLSDHCGVALNLSWDSA